MGSTQFGNFNNFCRDSTLPVCNLFSPWRERPQNLFGQLQGYGRCELMGIGLGRERHLGNLGSILIAFIAICVAILLILRADRKQAAVGRREFQLFLVGYIIIEICEIFTVGGLPMGSPLQQRVVLGFTAIHLGAIVATLWVLMLNGIVGFQLLDDGTPLSLGLILLSAAALFIGTGYIALDTAFSYSGRFDSSMSGDHRNIGLYVLYQLAPLVFLAAFFVLETVLVLKVLGEKKPMLYLIGAALLFALGQIFHYPLITLSTRAQLESKRAHSSTYDAVRRIVQREGVTGLYSGLESALFGISVTNFVYYYSNNNPRGKGYEWTRAFFERAAVRSSRASKNLTTIESMIAGAIAGSATVLITNPIWVVNTRMTARKSSSSAADDKDSLPEPATAPKSRPSTVSTLLSLLRTEGPGALFAGVLPALVLVINPILQYTIFEQLKNMLEKRRKVTPRDIFLLGAIGKLLATSITYPYITIKSRMHVKEGTKEGMGQAAKRAIKEEGWTGLYRGIGPKVTQSVITAAFLFAFKDALYEASVKLRRRVPAQLPGK
ncbi:MAG: hypothetical protein L6R35_000001 [Caloplaca aegaea]|nr:MAG: hypothetical protein L6R35_000001 [Caloplaca aegaea]